MDIFNQPLNTTQLAHKLSKAREANGKSLKETSDLLGIPTSRLRNYEKGKYIPTLPELESLSYIYRIPLFELVGEKEINDFVHLPDADQLQQLILIRQEIISTRIQLAIEDSGISYEDLSEKTGITTYLIKRYESGDSQPSVDELMQLCGILGIDFSDLADCESPIGQWQELQRIFRDIKTMPRKQAAFFADSKNAAHLENAKKIADIGLGNLTQLRDALDELLENLISNDPIE